MNVLGRLLMELRQELQTGPKNALGNVTPPNVPNFRLLSRNVGMVRSREKDTGYSQPSMFGH